MEEYYIYSLFIGDEARYDYIADVCRNWSLRGGRKRADMKFVYGTTYSEKEGDGMMYITSPFVPPGCCYFFPKDSMAGGAKHPKEYRAVYIFEEFPYGKGTIGRLLGKDEAHSDGEGMVSQLVQTGRVQDYNSVVVLYWRNRRFGIDNMEPAQDTQTGMPSALPKGEGDAMEGKHSMEGNYSKEELLRSAKEKYQGKCAKVIIYDETDPNRDMVFGKSGLEYGFVKRIRYHYNRDFEDGYHEFVRDFQADYVRDIERELTDYTEKNIKLLGIFNYSNVKKAKVPLWKFFVQSYEKELFCDILRDEIQDFCDKYLEDIYSCQHISQISNRIYSEWQKAYKLAFMNPSPVRDETIFRKITMERVPDNEMEYKKIAAEGNVMSIFKRQMNRFWGKDGKAEKICHDIIYEELKETRRRLEKVLQTDCASGRDAVAAEDMAGG